MSFNSAIIEIDLIKKKWVSAIGNCDIGIQIKLILYIFLAKITNNYNSMSQSYLNCVIILFFGPPFSFKEPALYLCRID